MHSRSLNEKIDNLVTAMGHTHRCQCRQTFFAHGEGSPCCGAGAMTIRLGKPEPSERGNVLYSMYVDEITGEIRYLFPDKSGSCQD